MSNPSVEKFELERTFKKNGFSDTAAALAARAVMERDNLLLERAFAHHAADGVSAEVAKEKAARDQEAAEAAAFDDLCNQIEGGMGVHIQPWERDQMLSKVRRQAEEARNRKEPTLEELEAEISRAMEGDDKPITGGPVW